MVVTEDGKVIEVDVTDKVERGLEDPMSPSKVIFEDFEISRATALFSESIVELKLILLSEDKIVSPNNETAPV